MVLKSPGGFKHHYGHYNSRCLLLNPKFLLSWACTNIRIHRLHLHSLWLRRPIALAVCSEWEFACLSDHQDLMWH